MEKDWEKRLNINTAGRDAGAQDDDHFPYEPTPYEVLERLSESGLIGGTNHVIDYGCGKGRVSFFLRHTAGCRVTGVEFEPTLLARAEENLQTYHGPAEGISFLLMDAAAYEVPLDADRFWFFNPFSEKVFRAVLARIEASWYEAPREMLLFFYYPSRQFISLLMTADVLEFEDEIDCSDLFPGEDPRERILIFRAYGEEELG